MKRLLILLVLLDKNYALFYDTYRGIPITTEELKRHHKANTTFWCTSDIAPCDPREGRRIDGSCNNLDNPSRGVGHTPFVRILPAIYDKDFEPRKAVSGRDLPLARYLRTRLLAEGHVPSQKFTQLFVHFLVFLSSDVLSQHDTANYILWKPYCCEPKGKTDKDCTPNMIPNDDPVHRFSNIRCFNMTRPQSFQSMGCVAKGTIPERIVSATPLLDLSVVYGGSDKVLLERFRTFRGGCLKYESENGKIWPPSYKLRSASICYLNNGPFETRCHNTPEDGANTLVGINLFVVWFWRLHNLIATGLAKVNPCWDDQKLFDTARDINIATVLQLMYYEALPLLLGRENLERDGVITRRLGFRDIYNPKAIPQISLEYPYALRWLHTMQEGSLKMYDTCGAYLKKEPIVNLTLRTGFINNNIVSITQGCFRQGAAAADYIVDPDISEIGLGPHQRAADITTSDLSKSRYFGFQSYIKYREFCYSKPIKCWSDLRGVIDPERIESLQCSYENVNDIELLAGIWLERHIPGGSAPSTFYCLVVDQLLRNIVSDRHWYERPNRPNAFTFPQLLEIRKRTIAGMLCDIGDSVSKIQPHAFLRTGPFNKMVDCSQITKFDYSKWKDLSCNRPVYWNTYG